MDVSAGKNAFNPKQAVYRLHIQRDGSSETHTLEGQRWVIGRAEDCDLQILDPTASRRHLVLERDGDILRFRDLGGTNALLVNGRPQREGELKAGTILLVGMTRLTVELAPEPSPYRFVDDARTRSIMHREIFDEDAVLSRRLDHASLPKGCWPALSAALESLTLALDQHGTLDSAARSLLETCLELTGRSAGLLGHFGPYDRLQVLVAVNEQPGEVLVPSQIVTEARHRRDPLLIHPGQPDEQLVIPLPGPPFGLMLLQSPRPFAPAGQTVLRLARILGRIVVARFAQVQERRELQAELQQLRFARSPSHDAVQASVRLQSVLRQLEQCAALPMPVFLHGEEGTERGDLARYLHDQGPDAGGPFVPFYCGVIPPDQADQELLGPSPCSGMAIGAGALHRAKGGTLFLDQPELLPMEVQERLAQQLTTEATPVRLVCGSSNLPDIADPEAVHPLLANQMLGITVEIPALRDHPADILVVTDLILREMGPGPDGALRSMTEATKQLLLRYRWPGNLGELRRVLEAAAAKAGAQPLAPRHLPQEIREPSTDSVLQIPSLAEIEHQHIQHVMDAVGGNRKRAAEVLGIAISTLYERLKSKRSP